MKFVVQETSINSISGTTIKAGANEDYPDLTSGTVVEVIPLYKIGKHFNPLETLELKKSIIRMANHIEGLEARKTFYEDLIQTLKNTQELL